MKICLVFLVWLSILSGAYTQNTLPPVRFEQGPVYFSQNFNAPFPTPQPEEILNGRYIRYIQCGAILLTEQRSRIESEGLEFLSYVDFGTYLVAIPDDFDLEKLHVLDVRSIAPVAPEWKMSRALREPPYGDWAIHGSWLDVQMQVYPHVPIAQGAEFCRQNGLRVVQEGRQNGCLRVLIPLDQIQQVAALPFVQYLDLAPPPPEPDDTRGRSLHRSNLLDRSGANGLHLDGTGVNVLVRDDGLVGPHIDFQGRLHNLSTDNGADQHGDGVAGIFGGAGNRDPSKRGMAAGAEVFVINYNADFQDETLPLFLNQNVTLTNSSYSELCNQGYNLNAQTVDQQLFEHPTLMHVFSSGNRGNTSCGYGAGAGWGNVTGGHKIAKNAIATANLRPDGTLDETSSRGPAADGRLKPDISANGTDEASTSPGNAYITFGGTSAASPGIAGCLAQLTQGWKQEHSGQNPPTALLKAALLNTATDLGNPGPDFRFGYGQVNAWRAWQLLHQGRWYTYQIDQGQPGVSVVINVPPGTRQAKVMLLWADPPAIPNAQKILINDLNLKVTNSFDTLVNLPLVLNPAPDPILLDQAAQPGLDTLNNVEQVVLNNPQYSSYLATITASAVPMGPQRYWLVWEFLSDSVQITYPAGGEGFAPGETERIRWDAFGSTPGENFTLEFFDGQSWSLLASPAYYEQFYDWTVPQNIVTSKARLRLTRNGISHEMAEFNIVGVPQSLDITRVCPDSMTLSWSPVNDTLAYEVYLLGDRYMELVGLANAPSLTFPIDNALTEKWVSVRTVGNAGLAGRRAVAIGWPGELKNCQQAKDLGVRVLLSPDPNGVFACGPVAQPVSVLVRNEGLDPISGAVIHLQVDGNAPVAESLPELDPGAALTHTFQAILSLTTNDSLHLNIWATYPADDFKWNDTLRTTLPVVTQPAADYFTQTFNNPSFPPLGWSVLNPDGALSWQRSTNVTGIDGMPARALWINCYDYSGVGQEDAIQLIPVDLSAITNPALVFEVSHARFGTHLERLRVEIVPGCDAVAEPMVIWQKTDPELATTTPSTGSFSPNEPADWRSEVVDLSAFSGQTVLIRLVATNDYGNNIFLDHVGIQPYNLVPPVAEFAAPDSICRGDTLLFAAVPAGNSAEYNWIFGSGALPLTAFGPGPHAVFYPAPGLKQVRLVVSNPLGMDTLQHLLTVLGYPTADFAIASNGLSVSFNNLSQNALSYQWDFGDGMGSTEFSPEHNYPGGGNYLVRLSASNSCKTVADSLVIALSVGTNSVQEMESLRLVPNPTEGDFRLELRGTESGKLRFDLLDATGRVVYSGESQVSPGLTVVLFTPLNLPKGMYALRITGAHGVKVMALEVQ